MHEIKSSDAQTTGSRKSISWDLWHHPFRRTEAEGREKRAGGETICQACCPQEAANPVFYRYTRAVFRGYDTERGSQPQQGMRPEERPGERASAFGPDSAAVSTGRSALSKNTCLRSRSHMRAWPVCGQRQAYLDTVMAAFLSLLDRKHIVRSDRMRARKGQYDSCLGHYRLQRFTKRLSLFSPAISEICFTLWRSTRLRTAAGGDLFPGPTLPKREEQRRLAEVRIPGLT